MRSHSPDARLDHDKKYVALTSKAARLHSDLARRFIELEKEFLPEKATTRAELDRLEAARLTIEADEPPILRILDSVCHNELLRAMGYEDEVFLKIFWFQRLFANFIDIAPGRVRVRALSTQSVQPVVSGR